MDEFKTWFFKKDRNKYNDMFGYELGPFETLIIIIGICLAIKGCLK